MEFTGFLVGRVADRSGNGTNGPWRIGSYLLQTVEREPKRMVVDVSDGQWQRCAQWDALIGKNVTIQFDIEAREWQNKWYNTLRGWMIKEATPQVSQTGQQVQQAQTGQAQPQGTQQPMQAGQQTAGTVSNAPFAPMKGVEDDKLPF